MLVAIIVRRAAGGRGAVCRESPTTGHLGALGSKCKGLSRAVCAAVLCKRHEMLLHWACCYCKLYSMLHKSITRAGHRTDAGWPSWGKLSCPTSWQPSNYLLILPLRAVLANWQWADQCRCSAFGVFSVIRGANCSTAPLCHPWHVQAESLVLVGTAVFIEVNQEMNQTF